MDDDLKLKHPFTAIISGPTGSGKSSFCVRFMQNLKSLCTEQNFDGGIIWCYSERTAVHDRELSKISNNIRLNKGVPENFENKNGKPCLIIVDVLLDVVYSNNVCNLFTKDTHHRNISVILIIQNLFHQGQFCRDISLNAKYLVLLENVRDINQFMCMYRQLHHKGPNKLYNAYQNATTKPHGYLVLDLAQDTDDRLRFRTYIFPDEYPPIFYVDVNDETDKIELSRLQSTQLSTDQITQTHNLKRKP